VVDVVLVGVADAVLLVDEVELVLVLLVVVGVQPIVVSSSKSQSPVSLLQQARYPTLRLAPASSSDSSPPSGEHCAVSALQTELRQARSHIEVAQESSLQRRLHFA
jgi:hypothetical protein